MEVAGEAANATDALRILRDRAAGFDLVLLDLALPDKSGIMLIGDIKREAPQLPILVMSSYAESQYALDVLSRGASGYVEKGTDSEALLRAVRSVAKGQNYLSAAVLQTIARVESSERTSGLLGQFSPREREILLRIVAGMGLTDIGRELGLSVKTVSTYRTRILEKTGFKNNAELVRYALHHGLIK